MNKKELKMFKSSRGTGTIWVVEHIQAQREYYSEESAQEAYKALKNGKKPFSYDKWKAGTDESRSK